MTFEKILLAGGIMIAAIIALKYVKQLISLSLTLLSLKIVWIALIILFVLMSLKKRMQRSHEIQKQ
jgi:hypothetical protein